MCHPYTWRVIGGFLSIILRWKWWSGPPRVLFEIRWKIRIIIWNTMRIWLLNDDRLYSWIFYPDHLSQWLPMIKSIFFGNSFFPTKKRNTDNKKTHKEHDNPPVTFLLRPVRRHGWDAPRHLKWGVRSPYGCAFFYRLYLPNGYVTLW